MIVEVAVEGVTDEPVARRLLDWARLQVGSIRTMNGTAKLDEKLPAFAMAAKHSPFFVMRDLDDEPCPGGLVARLLPPRKANRLIFRIAVRKVEAWLLGDSARFAEVFRVPPGKLPKAPESLANPKRELVNIVRSSVKPAIVSAIVPRQGESRQVGPEYVSMIGRFASEAWRPEVARQSCPSLDRCLRALERLANEAA